MHDIACILWLHDSDALLGDLLLVLEGSDLADIHAHGSIKFKGITAGGGLR